MLTVQEIKAKNEAIKKEREAKRVNMVIEEPVKEAPKKQRNSQKGKKPANRQYLVVEGQTEVKEEAIELQEEIEEEIKDESFNF